MNASRTTGKPSASEPPPGPGGRGVPTVAERVVLIVERLAARDDQALGELYDLFGATLYALALRIVRVPGDAEEVTQEAFLYAWSAPPLSTPIARAWPPGSAPSSGVGPSTGCAASRARRVGARDSRFRWPWPKAPRGGCRTTRPP